MTVFAPDSAPDAAESADLQDRPARRIVHLFRAFAEAPSLRQVPFHAGGRCGPCGRARCLQAVSDAS
jgi:hypothetical protein